MDVQIPFQDAAFNSLGYNPRSGIAGSYGNSIFRTAILFPQQLHHFTFPPTVHNGSNASTTSPTLIFFFCFLVCLMIANLMGVRGTLEFLMALGATEPAWNCPASRGLQQEISNKYPYCFTPFLIGLKHLLIDALLFL